MNLIRSIITVFLFALLAVSVAGWVWAAGLPSAHQIGARFVLAICGLSAIGGGVLLWSVKRPAPAE